MIAADEKDLRHGPGGTALLTKVPQFCGEAKGDECLFLARLRNLSHLPKSVWSLGYCRLAVLTLSSSRFDPQRRFLGLFFSLPLNIRQADTVGPTVQAHISLRSRKRPTGLLELP